ncbi:DUF4861 family protein [Sunxiuqinia indica]|uniref:DUF4861 family protein n=1 Tax=Sunxiuqinia indica TaxID=2692584 RepID=UPI0021CFD0CA|nr:DUF4861 family protein [Sunxiuqinia indica]
MFLRKTLALLCLIFLVTGIISGQDIKQISTNDLVRSVIKKGLEDTNLDHYTGIVLLNAMTEFSLLEGNEDILTETIKNYREFGTGEIKPKGNFICYEAGGPGAAFLAWKTGANELKEQIAVTAAKMMKEQVRSPEGLMTSKHVTDDTHKVFIDMAYAVSAYLLYAGLALDNQEYIDFAVFETVELFKILKDKRTGLLHQSRGFNGHGNFSNDNWSRGNGWGAMAISNLARDLPDSHPRKNEVVNLARQFFTDLIQYQNKEGLWHQEITDPNSYVETSGSGSILYGMGIMLEKAYLDKKYMNDFKRGLQGYLDYIEKNGSIGNTCIGCLCPGNGTKSEYAKHPWAYNDPHAFGPAIMTFAQAEKMGIKEVSPLKELGYYASTPRTYVRFARGKEIAWENDRIAFRAYGPAVQHQIGNGIDVWAKSVDYPILDKWYELNAQGKDYHTDRGEGCDFYNMGFKRGCGGLAVWINGKPYPSETFDSYKIRRNYSNKIEFQLNYNTWDVPDLELQESKIIEMKKGTNLFKVTSTLKCEQDKELTIAIGLTTFGNPEIYQDKKHGLLSVWESINDEYGELGTAVLIDPEKFVGFASFDGDEFILIKVKTNIPFSYYSGAGWEKSEFFKNNHDWKKYIKEIRNTKF